MRATLYLAVLACSIALACSISTKPKNYEYEELEKWVIANGGMVNTVIGKNSKGYRGLFTKVAAKAGDKVATISGACMLNTGSITGTFLTPTLTVLRELLHPDSRLKPYLNVLPKRDEVLNACNMPDKYLPMLESDYWTQFVHSWQDYLAASLRGERNADAEWTIPEMLGNVNDTLTVDDLKYGCAISATRYVAVDKRQRLMMIPVYDMANHVRDCPHYISAYDDGDEVHIIAGTDVQPGDEICYSYGHTMRDDYAVMHYGFVPDLEDPPRLLQIDHHEFDPAKHHQEINTERFEGTPEEVRKELERQQKTLARLEQMDEARKGQDKPAPGTDYIHDTLTELQWRRRNALRYEVNRLKGALAAAGGRSEL